VAGSVRLQRLANRASHGDREAARSLKRELEVQLVRITRAVIRAGNGASAVSVRVLAEMAAVEMTTDETAAQRDDGAGLARGIAQRICDSVMTQVRARGLDGRALADTIRA
jgi:hypothetical protein